MQRVAQNEMPERDGGRILRICGDGSAAPGVTEGGLELPGTQMEHVQRAQYPQLIAGIANLFGDLKTPAQGAARRIAFAVKVHRRISQARLEMHFLDAAAGRIRQHGKGALRPAVAFRQKRHHLENRHRGRRKANAGAEIAVFTKAPFQRRANVVETDEIRHPVRPRRNHRPFRIDLFEPALIIGRVAHAKGGALGFAGWDFMGVDARGVQEPVAHHRADGKGRDQAFGDQAVDGAEHRRSIQRILGDDLERGIEGEISDEDRKPAKHDAFRLGEEPETPVEGGLQRLLARRRGARPLPPQRQMLVEQGCGLRQAVGSYSSGRQFHRERHAVEFSADAGDDARVRVAELETNATGRRTLHEQLRGRKRQNGLGFHVGIVGRTAKGVQPVDALAVDAQRLAAGREDSDLRRRLDDICGQRCDGVDQVFAGVEDQQNLFVAQIGHQAWPHVVGADRQTHHGRNAGGHQVGIAQHPEIDEQHGAMKGFARDDGPPRSRPWSCRSRRSRRC